MRRFWQQSELTTAVARMEDQGVPIKLQPTQMVELAKATHEVTHNLGKAVRGIHGEDRPMGRPSKAEQQARNAAVGTDSARIKTTHHRRTTPPASDAQHIRTPAPALIGSGASNGGRRRSGLRPPADHRSAGAVLGKPKGTLYQWRSRRMGRRGISVGNDMRCRRIEVPLSGRLGEGVDRRGRVSATSLAASVLTPSAHIYSDAAA
jgi:hypothetical protein